jgi:hypothetical protein
MDAERELVAAQFNRDQRTPKVLVFGAGTIEFVTQETHDLHLDTTLNVPTGITTSTAPTRPLPEIATNDIEASLPVSSALSCIMAAAGIAWWVRNKFRRDRAFDVITRR